MIIEKNNNNIPDYLDKEFFENAISNGLNCSNVEVKSLNFKMGSSGGENYLSYIYRVEVIYVQNESIPKELYLIVKSIPLDGPRERFAELNIYSKEKQMYQDVIPKFEEQLDDVKIAPKCYYAIAEPIATIVFEDMNVLGYSVADRVKGLNEEHCKMVLRNLGQYHAASLIYLEKNPSFREEKVLQQGLFCPSNMLEDRAMKSFESRLNILIEHISQWSGFEEITEKLKNLSANNILEKAMKNIEISSNDLVVLNHGDMWVNNFLYKYKENSKSPTDVVLIDFQGSYFGSPGLDINYFLSSSPKLDVLINSGNSLIENSYYPTLRTALEAADYKDIPSLDEINNEIQKKAWFKFFNLMTVFPFITMQKEDSANNSIENFEDKNFAQRIITTALSAKRFLETMKIELKKFDKIGLFD